MHSYNECYKSTAYFVVSHQAAEISAPWQWFMKRLRPWQFFLKLREIFMFFSSNNLSVSDPDPHSIRLLNLDPHSECGLGSRMNKNQLK
jgi:hypothetical protein